MSHVEITSFHSPLNNPVYHHLEIGNPALRSTILRRCKTLQALPGPWLAPISTDKVPITLDTIDRLIILQGHVQDCIYVGNIDAESIELVPAVYLRLLVEERFARGVQILVGLSRRGQHLPLVLHLSKEPAQGRFKSKANLKGLPSALSDLSRNAAKDEEIDELVLIHIVDVLKCDLGIGVSHHDPFVHDLSLLADLINTLLKIEIVVEMLLRGKRNEWLKFNVVASSGNGI